MGEIVQGFDAELQKLWKSEFGRKLGHWTPIGIGSLAALAGAAISEPTVAIGSAAVSVIIQIIQGFGSQTSSETAQDQVQKLLAKMQKDILKPSQVKELA